MSSAVPTVQALQRGDFRRAVSSTILTGFCWWPILDRLRRSTVVAESTSAPPEDLRARGGRGWLLPIVLLVVAGVLGVVGRVRGGTFDSPGPTSPAQLARVLLVGRDNRDWGREQVRRAAARHGIPFSDDLIADVNSGRRKARLPGEGS